MTVRLLMFWSSYAPLFLLASIRFTDGGLRIANGLLCVGGVCALVLVLNGRARRLAADPFEVTDVRDEGASVAGYLVGYILPIATVASPTPDDVIAYGLFLVMLAVISTRTALLQVNPLLYLVGYRVFAIQTTSGFRGYLITPSETVVGTCLKAVTLTSDVLKTAPKSRSTERLGGHGGRS